VPAGVQRQLEGPALELLEEVRGYMEGLLSTLLDHPQLCKHFPRLAALLKEQAAALLQEKAAACRQQIRWLIE